jgi:hypothetical protein
VNADGHARARRGEGDGRARRCDDHRARCHHDRAGCDNDRTWTLHDHDRTRSDIHRVRTLDDHDRARRWCDDYRTGPLHDHDRTGSDEDRTRTLHDHDRCGPLHDDSRPLHDDSRPLHDNSRPLYYHAGLLNDDGPGLRGDDDHPPMPERMTAWTTDDNALRQGIRCHECNRAENYKAGNFDALGSAHLRTPFRGRNSAAFERRSQEGRYSPARS